ncbi:endonuclease NucS [Cumulibacter manganitolerans]|uniref:endonuclease NucS n=1 Tax=Cumulibacter manganitolerans TaxID=1884992 RepID=UPI001295C836|nr:endonuclease NucS [Cumulibacter manganitolerans]
MRLVIATCEVDYAGRLSAHLPRAKRLLLVKNDGSVLVHSDSGSYKPLNWMSPPCRLVESEGEWTVKAKSGDSLVITIHEVHADTSHDLGVDPGLTKDGVEAHLQELLALHLDALGSGLRLVRREYPTPIGPVDIMCKDARGSVAIEVKRVVEISAVEQLTRYLELLNRDTKIAPVRGVLAGNVIKPQARTLAEDRGIECVVTDYDELRGLSDPAERLF